MIKEIYFDSNHLKLFGRLFIGANKRKCVIFLHGGGHSNCYRFDYIQNQLLKNRISSFAFDFRGCGKSEGSFEDGSLKMRLQDADSAIKYISQKLKIDVEDVIIEGGSMGGYIACRLLEKINPKGVILQCPAAYSKESESAKLNNKFTKLIAKKNSWAGSPAFDNLVNFNGKKIVLYGEFDKVIPVAVKERYREIVGNDNFIVLMGGEHRLLAPENKNQGNALKQLSDEIVKFVIT